MTAGDRDLSRLLLTGFLLALLGLTWVARFRALDHDLAWGITSYSTAFITDEGCYNKSARSLALHGELRHAMDRNIYTHSPLYTLLMAGVFKVFGVGLKTARAVSIFSLLASLGCFYLICRTRWSVHFALLGCLVISTTLHVVTYSRMAIVEPVGVAFSLAALLLWIRFPRRAGPCVLSMVLAACAFLLKIAFMFTLAVVTLLWSLDAADLHRRRSPARVRTLGLRIAVVLGLSFLALFAIRSSAGRDWTEMQQAAVGAQTQTLGLETLAFEIDSVQEFLLEEPQRVALLAALLLMVPALWLRRTGGAAKARVMGRAYLAMALWAAVGFVMFSMFEYRVPRYYYFLIYPMFFLALEGLAAFCDRKYLRPAVLALVAAHLALQIPDYRALFARELSESQAEMARSVARTVTRSGEPPLLLGLQAAFVALFDDRIRPLELDFVDRPTLCRRIDWWRPPFLLHYDSELASFERPCPGVVQGIERLRYYWVMEGFHYGSEVVLARILYEPSDPGVSR